MSGLHNEVPCNYEDYPSDFGTRRCYSGTTWSAMLGRSKSMHGPIAQASFSWDADPPDLLIFAWLRRHVAIEFLGVKDRFLQNYFTGSLDRISITLSESELESRGFLAEMMPDYSTLLGDCCSQLLAEGFKIELEGATLSIKTPRGNLNSDV